MRSRYNPSYEDETLSNFLTGKPLDLSWMQDWLRMVREATAEGRRFARVRVVDLPMSDWNRYSYALAQHNITAGEDIRYLARDQAGAASCPATTTGSSTPLSSSSCGSTRPTASPAAN